MAGDGASPQTKRALVNDPDLDQGLYDAPVGAAAAKVQAPSDDKNRKVYTPQEADTSPAGQAKRAAEKAKNEADYLKYKESQHKRH